MINSSISQHLSRFAVQLTYEQIPQDITEQLKGLFMDTVGCILAGHVEPSNTILVNTLRARGGNPDSTVFGYGFLTDPAAAAMMNGAVGHTVELDDDHREGTIHTGVVVIPTALAIGEMIDASGKDILTAALVGYEVGIRIGKAFLGDLFYQGFHPTGVCGVFASAAAAGKLLKLNEEQMVNALGIAGSQASGNREWKASGAWTKRLQAGHANFSGITAALLAKSGFTGPVTSIEGTYGLLNSYAYKGHYDASCILNGLGKDWEIRNNSLKPHASCRFAQPIIDSTLAIVKSNNLYAKDILKIRVGTGKNALISLAEPSERKYHPKTRVDAQFSLPYAAAVAIHRRRAFMDEFTVESFTDYDILATAAKVSYYLDEVSESMWPICYAAVVEIETIDGRVFTERTDYPKGDPENPMTEKEINEKFTALAGSTLNGECIPRVAEMFDNFNELKDIHGLCDLLKGDEHYANSKDSLCNNARGDE